MPEDVEERGLRMEPETKEFLKSLKDLIAFGLKGFADSITLGVPRSIYESHIERQVEKKIVEKRLPFGRRKPRSEQYWSLLKLGETEKEVVSSLGLPYSIEPVEESESYEYTFDEKWWYDRGHVYFKNKIVVAVYMWAPDETVRKGFPIGKQINVPVPKPTSPCPYCGSPLNTPLAKQCLSCHMDWHDPNNVIKHNVTP